MENIIFSANVVLPLLLVMVVGYIIRQLKWISAPDAKSFNSLTFTVFLPILLFNNVRNSSLETLPTLGFFLFVAVGSLACFAVAALIVPIIEPENPKRGVMIQGIARTNYSIFGIPLLTMLMPHADIGIASILVAIVIPIYNIVCVIVLAYYGSKHANLKNVCISIAKNPLIIGTTLGILFLFCGWSLPYPIDQAALNLGSIATPLSLFLLGSSFEFKKLHAVLKQTIITVTARLVIIPIIMLTLAVMMGFRDVELACIMIVFSSPTAVSSYTMAEKMGGDAPLASAVVLFTSIFCVFTLFLIILALRTLGLI